MNHDTGNILMLAILISLIVLFSFLIFSMQNVLLDIGFRLGNEWLIFRLLVAVLLLVALASLFLRLLSSPAKTKLEVLHERHEKGDISAEEFENRAQNLRGVH